MKQDLNSLGNYFARVIARDALHQAGWKKLEVNFIRYVWYADGGLELEADRDLHRPGWREEECNILFKS